MEAAHNVVLRGGVADGQTLIWSDIGSPIEWEDVGGGVATYLFADVEETVDGVTLSVYRLADQRY
jgi:hypothetical protein